MADLMYDSTVWTSVVETAFDRVTDFILRDVPFFRDVADKRPVQQAMPGDVVNFTIHGELPIDVTPLTETVDPATIQPPAPTRVPVTLREYGAATLRTLYLRELAFTRVDMEAAIQVARNQADTIDRIVGTVIDGGDHILSKQGGALATDANFVANSVVATDVGDAKTMAAAVSLLRRRKVVYRSGELYVAYIHPDVAYDIMQENGAGSNVWVLPKQYQDQGSIMRGEVGTYMGAKYIVSARCTHAPNTAATPVEVYNSYFFGQQALAEVMAVEPGVRIGMQTDRLKRFYPLGWYSLGGWAIYRQEAQEIVKTASSIAAL